MYYGSEFQRHLTDTLADHLYAHWHTYPKTPTMNAHCECFDRIVQEAFIDYDHDLEFPDDFTDFNSEPLRWRSRYNLE
jgi:transposase InsO family protein